MSSNAPLNAAETNRTSIRYIPEAVFCTTPANGITRALRYTSSSLVPTKDTAISDEIRADRMVSDLVEVGANSAGTIEGEFSAGTWDAFLEAGVLGTWSRPMEFWSVRGSSVRVTGASQITITGQDLTAVITNGRVAKLEGFTTPANNAYVTVSGTSFTGGNTVITVTESTLVAENGTANSRLFDAADVFSKATTTTLDSANTITGAAGAFTNANLKIGQTIYLEGLGKGSGTVVVDAVPDAGDTVIVSDGVDTVTFEFNATAGAVTTGNVFVSLASATVNGVAAALAAAVNAKFAARELQVSATVSTDTVTMTQHRGAGGSISSASADITETSFSGGDNTKFGYFTIASLPDTETIIVNETLGTDANSGGALVVIKGSHLRNSGVLNEIIRRSFTIEQGYVDVGQYFLFRGQRVGNFSLNFAQGEISTVSFEFSGAETVVGQTATLTGGSYTPLNTNDAPVMNGTSNVTSVRKDDAELDSAVMSISFSVDNSLRDQRAVGSKFPRGIGYGRMTGEVTMEVYFQNLEFYRDFFDHRDTGVGITVKDGDNQAYVFNVPRVKVAEDPVEISGIDADVMENITAQMIRSGTLNTQMMIDRFSSIYPVAG